MNGNVIAMIIEVSGLTKCFGSVKALDGLDLTVEDGELYAFLGPNGAGKTTTIRILNGLAAKSGGSVKLGGVDIAENPLAAKRLCGLAAQHLNLDAELTVTENLDFHGRLYGMSRPDRRDRIGELLEYVEMADRASSLVKTLSGGFKRRLMLARALLHRPRLLFLDEPTAGLDPAIRRRLWNLIKRVRKDGVTIFLTTHYIEEAEFLADRVGFVHQGRRAGGGSPIELVSQLGMWAVDHFNDQDMSTTYFANRDDADRHMRELAGEFALRRVNLEDVFLSLTGKKVE